MVPDLELQIGVVIKALSDTVIPALDPSQKVAMEQLGLSIATLGMVRSHLPLEAAREWAALSHAHNLAASVNEALAERCLTDPLDAAKSLLAEGNPPPGARKEATRHLLAAVSQIAREESTPQAVLKLIVERSKASTDLVRAWSIGSGFEPDPDQVPAIEELLPTASF